MEEGPVLLLAESSLQPPDILFKVEFLFFNYVYVCGVCMCVVCTCVCAYVCSIYVHVCMWGVCVCVVCVCSECMWHVYVCVCTCVLVHMSVMPAEPRRHVRFSGAGLRGGSE